MKGILGQLLLIFIVLKLCGIITWSWWLVLLPILPWVLMIVFGIFLFWLLEKN